MRQVVDPDWAKRAWHDRGTSALSNMLLDKALLQSLAADLLKNGNPAHRAALARGGV
jgi:hypothetical protein